MALRNWLLHVTQAYSPLVGNGQLYTDPYYRLQSIAEVQQAAKLGVVIDVNRATVDDWLRLPGLSIHQARTLAELTQTGVQFHCLEDVAAALGIPADRLKPLEPILRFCYYAPDELPAVPPVNANTATIDMLARIPGVDPFLARAIVQNRQQGAYRNLAHLQRRLSLSKELTAQLLHYLRF
jgi:DNA uptake protein ComE-like DNA-binding protein